MRVKLLCSVAQAAGENAKYGIGRARLRFHSPVTQTSWCE